MSAPSLDTELSPSLGLPEGIEHLRHFVTFQQGPWAYPTGAVAGHLVSVWSVWKGWWELRGMETGPHGTRLEDQPSSLSSAGRKRPWRPGVPIVPHSACLSQPPGRGQSKWSLTQWPLLPIRDSLLRHVI